MSAIVSIGGRTYRVSNGAGVVDILGFLFEKKFLADVQSARGMGECAHGDRVHAGFGVGAQSLFGDSAACFEQDVLPETFRAESDQERARWTAGAQLSSMSRQG